ncbi:MAG: hypothetical protein Greene041619_767 [Candidatus Peregrinibacteria bacterium Greene0416_19]|nr:MAG: hypothetical protein Greene041619_767 [Candidatus Peregrinibacteria bacterium Greene0416_19]
MRKMGWMVLAMTMVVATVVVIRAWTSGQKLPPQIIAGRSGPAAVARFAQQREAREKAQAQEHKDALERARKKEEQASRLSLAEEQDMTLLRDTTNAWGKMSPAQRWSHLEELKRDRTFSGYPKQQGPGTPDWVLCRYLATEKGKAEASLLQAEIAQPFADGKAKAEAILKRIAQATGIQETKPEVGLFFDSSLLPALEAIEKEILEKSNRKEAVTLLKKAANEGAFGENENGFWFFINGYEEGMKPILKAEWETELARRKQEMGARKPDLVLNQTGGTIRRMRFSPDGSAVAVMNLDGGLQTYESATGKPIQSFAHASMDGALAWSPDGKHIAAGGDGEFLVFATDGTLAKKQGGIGDVLPVTDIAWKGDMIAAKEMAQTVGIFRFPAMECVYKGELQAYEVNTLAALIDEKGIGRRSVVQARSVEAPKIQPKAPVRISLKEEVKGSLRALNEASGMELWKVDDELLEVRRKDGSVLSNFRHPPYWGRSAEFTFARFSPDGGHVVFAGGNGFLHVHESKTGKEIFRAHFCIGWMQDEFGYQSGGMIESLDLTEVDGELIVAVGGTGGVAPVALYKIDLNK